MPNPESSDYPDQQSILIDDKLTGLEYTLIADGSDDEVIGQVTICPPMVEQIRERLIAPLNEYCRALEFDVHESKVTTKNPDIFNHHVSYQLRKLIIINQIRQINVCLDGILKQYYETSPDAFQCGASEDELKKNPLFKDIALFAESHLLGYKEYLNCERPSLLEIIYGFSAFAKEDKFQFRKIFAYSISFQTNLFLFMAGDKFKSTIHPFYHEYLPGLLSDKEPDNYFIRLVQDVLFFHIECLLAGDNPLTVLPSLEHCAKRLLELNNVAWKNSDEFNLLVVAPVCSLANKIQEDHIFVLEILKNVLCDGMLFFSSQYSFVLDEPLYRSVVEMLNKDAENLIEVVDGKVQPRASYPVITVFNLYFFVEIFLTAVVNDLYSDSDDTLGLILDKLQVLSQNIEQLRNEGELPEPVRAVVRDEGRKNLPELMIEFETMATNFSVRAMQAYRGRKQAEKVEAEASARAQASAAFAEHLGASLAAMWGDEREIPVDNEPGTLPALSQ